jgi:aldehyde dehydrogenase (NAD+)
MLVAQMLKLKIGDPSDASTQIGPQADTSQAASVERYLAIGKTDGQALVGGKKAGFGVNYVEPTIFTNIADTSKLNVEEIFGPVLILHEFDTEAEVIKRANETECESLSV